MAERTSLPRWIFRIAGIGAVLALVYLGVIAVQVVNASNLNERVPADAIVVLGAAQYDGTPSPALQRRLDRALELYQDGLADEIVLTGSKQPNDRYTEAFSGFRYLAGLGVPESDLPRLAREAMKVTRLLRNNPRDLTAAQVRDTLRLCDLHPTDFALLRRQFKDAGRRVTVEQADGFEVLKAALPPPSRRGLVLIDPSYEIKSDYMKVSAALKDGLKRFATGTYLVWHPMLPTIDANQMPDRLKRAGAGHWLHATLSVRAPATKGRGMHGSGMFVINPPWTLQATLEECLPLLASALAIDSGAGWTLDSFEQPAKKD